MRQHLRSFSRGSSFSEDVQVSSPGPSFSHLMSPRPARRELASQQYLEMQRGLLNLHRMAEILPPVKMLDGEIVKLDEVPIAGGTYSDIWLARWLNEEKVAIPAFKSCVTYTIIVAGSFEGFAQRESRGPEGSNGGFY